MLASATCLMFFPDPERQGGAPEPQRSKQSLKKETEEEGLYWRAGNRAVQGMSVGCVIRLDFGGWQLAAMPSTSFACVPEPFRDLQQE
jgi:hypothetical protein